MTLTLRPLAEGFGAEIVGIDLRQPISDERWAEIESAFVRYSVLLFREQALSKAEHVALSRRFGTLEHHVLSQHTDPAFPEIFVLGSVREPDGGVPFLNRNDVEWHSDSSFMARPSLGSLLYCKVTPRIGGDTMFTSMHRAYDTLPPPLKRMLQGRVARHSFAYFHDEVILPITPGMKPMTPEQRARTPDVVHPLVRLHPLTGRRSVFFSSRSIREITGLDFTTVQALVADLLAHATAPDAVYSHAWRVGDMVIYDNRATMHTATPYDFDGEPRLLHRTTICGEAPLPAPPEALVETASA